VVARVRRDFPAEEVAAVVARLSSLDLPLSGDGPHTRVEAALLVIAAGSWSRFARAAADAELDWRDTLVAAGFEHEDWPAKVDAFLAPG
jgi:hypothetical protein